MSDVEISAEFYKVDNKTGDIIRDKDGKPKDVKFKALSTTNQQGECVVTVKRENKTLKLKKYIDGQNEYYSEVQIPSTTDQVVVTLNERTTTTGKITTVGKTTEGVLKVLQMNNRFK